MKKKKCLEISSVYICVPQMTIIWCMVPEAWSTTDRLFCHFGLFLLFYFTNQKNQNFEKMKTISGDIQIHIILQLHTTNEDHMIYKMKKKKKKKNIKKKNRGALQSHDVWFLRYGVQQAEFLVILGHFLPFYPTNNPQNQIFEKIIILHKCTKNLDHIIMFICYTVPEIWCVRCFFFFILGYFLPF